MRVGLPFRNKNLQRQAKRGRHQDEGRNHAWGEKSCSVSWSLSTESKGLLRGHGHEGACEVPWCCKLENVDFIREC